MPVDDADILTKKISLQSKLDLISRDRANIIRIYQAIESVEKDDRGNMPMDEGTRVAMTPARRQAIYDQAVSDFNALP